MKKFPLSLGKIFKSSPTKKKILIIDDEEALAEVVKLGLELTDKYEVRIATRSKEGLAIAEEFLPDAVLLDLMLPDMSGDDVATQMKKSEATRETPIIFMTGIASQVELQGNTSMFGGHAYMAKPIRIKELDEKLDQIFRDSKYLR